MSITSSATRTARHHIPKFVPTRGNDDLKILLDRRQPAPTIDFVSPTVRGDGSSSYQIGGSISQACIPQLASDSPHTSTWPDLHMMGGYSVRVPGLNQALKVHDLEESRHLYNVLPTDSQQPEILELHIHNIAAIIVRNRAEKVFGIHLAHGHFTVPEDTTLLGVNYDEPYCRWARPTAIRTVDLSNVHGHIFVLTDYGFHPYEYQIGPLPNLSGVDRAFLVELAEYLITNQLTKLVGLQIIDPNSTHMLELVLPHGTVMLDASILKGCVPTRQTGWKFESEDGEPRVCKSYETHGKHANGHDIYNEGAPHPKLETFQDVKNALVEVGILCQ